MKNICMKWQITHKWLILKFNFVYLKWGKKIKNKESIILNVASEYTQ